MIFQPDKMFSTIEERFLTIVKMFSTTVEMFLSTEETFPTTVKMFLTIVEMFSTTGEMASTTIKTGFSAWEGSIGLKDHCLILKNSRDMAGNLIFRQDQYS